MDKKNITPNPQQPVDRVPSGQLPSALAELNEEEISSFALPGEYADFRFIGGCSYDGEDE